MNEITPVLQIPDFLQVSGSGSYAVKQGPKVYNPTIVNSNVSGNPQAMPCTINFNAKPPSNAIIMSRDIWLAANITVTITTTGQDGAASGNLWDQTQARNCLRAYPLSQTIINSSATINTETVTLQTNQVINPLLRCNITQDSLAQNTCGCPNQLDYCSEYSVFGPNIGYAGSGTANADLLTKQALEGGIGPMNCMVANGAMRAPGSCRPRACWPITYSGTNNTTSAEFTFDTFEPLWLSPFHLNTKNNFPIINCNNLTFTFVFNNPEAMLSLNRGGAFDNAATPFKFPLDGGAIWTVRAVINNLQLYVTQITPPDWIQRPLVAYYPYYATNFFGNLFNGECAPQASTTFTSSNIQVNSIPARMLIYLTPQAVQPGTGALSLLPNSYPTITACTVNWDNVSVFTNANSQELWMMSKENGYRGSYEDWAYGFGSILILDLSKNLTLISANEAPGMPTNKQFNVKVTFTNNFLAAGDSGANTAAYTDIISNWTLNCIMINHGILTLTAQNTAKLIDAPLKQEAVSAVQRQPVLVSEFPRDELTVYGGNTGHELTDKKISRRAARMGVKRRRMRGRGLSGGNIDDTVEDDECELDDDEYDDYE